MKGLAAKVREAIIDLSRAGDISYAEIANRLDLVTDRDKQPVYNTLRDFLKRGECIRVSKGVVRYVPSADPSPAKKASCMFRFIRANRNNTLTVSDLMANCKASRNTAREYLQMLTRRGITRRIDMPNNQPAKYQMIHDPGPNMIKNEYNAEKLRRLRQTHGEVLQQIGGAELALSQAAQALEKARKAMSDASDETNEKVSDDIQVSRFDHQTSGEHGST